MNAKSEFKKADRVVRGWAQYEGSGPESALEYARRGYRPDYHEGKKRPWSGALPSIESVRLAFRLRGAHVDGLDFGRECLAQARSLGRRPLPYVLLPSWYRFKLQPPPREVSVQHAHARGVSKRPPLPV